MHSLLFIVTAAYTILLITRPHEFLPALAQSPLLQIVLLCGFGIWLLTRDKGTELPQFRVLPVFLLFVWLSLGFAGWWGGIVPALDKLLPPILLFVIVSGCVRSVRELKIYSAIVIACACVLVFHGHLQQTTGIGWTGQPMIEGRITYSGIFNDPNDIGLLIVLSIALCIFQLRVQHNRIVRWLMFLALASLLYGVYLTDSRGTMLATLVVLGLEAWRAWGKAAVVAIGALAIPVLLAFTRLAQLDPEEASANNRVDAWYEGVQMLVDYPFFGVGWGMFSDHHEMTAHNSLVLAMAELGLTGYTFWLAFVLLTGWMIFRLAFPEGMTEGTNQAATAQPTPPASSQALAGVYRINAVRIALTAHVAAGFDQARAWQARDAAAVGESIAKTIDDTVERLAARSLFFAVSGFGVGAFFLSQSYKAMLFLNCGLVVGRYLGMREAGVLVPRFGLAERFPVVVAATLGSVVGLWILVRILI